MLLKTMFLVIYFLILLAIGIYSSKNIKSQSDYDIGGRSSNKWVTGISTQAASASGWLLLALPGAAFTLGFGVIWILLGWMSGSLINWFIISKRLRNASEFYNSNSVVEFIEKRTNDKNGLIALVSSIVLVIIMIVNSSAELIAIGKLINVAFNINYFFSVTIGLLFIMVYIFLGGYLAVSWANLIQGTMMVLALVVIPIILSFQISSLSTLTADLISQDPHYFQLLAGETSFWGIIAFITGGLGIGLMFPGYIQALTGLIAIKNVEELKFSAILANLWGALSLAGAAAIGFIGRYLVKSIEDPEQILLVLGNEYFSSSLFAMVSAAVLAASLSSIFAYIITAATSVGANFLKEHMSEEYSNNIIRWERIAVVVISISGYVMALQGGLVFAIAMFAASILGASFGPIVLASIYSESINKYGVIASIISGMVTVIIWHYAGWSDTYIFEVIPGWIVSVSTLFIVSKATGGPDKESKNQYNDFKVKTD